MRLESTARYEDFEPFLLEECEKVVAERLSDDTFWVVELKEQRKVIGDLCYREGDYETYEIAYDFNENYWKKGYASEACSMFIDERSENRGRACAYMIERVRKRKV